MKREERLDTVERISRANEFKKKIVMDKIDNMRIRNDHVQSEKKKMMAHRLKLRSDAEVQKRHMLEQVEIMKRKGNFNKEELAKLGIDMD